MIFLGLDPDLKGCPIAGVNGLGKLLFVVTTRVPKAKKGEAQAKDTRIAMIEALFSTFHRFHHEGIPVTAVAVEGQDLSYTRGYAAQDIADLSAVSGAALAYSRFLCPRATYFPKPAAWKGQVKKVAHQARTFERLGIPFERVGVSVGSDGLQTVSNEAYCRPVARLFDLNPGDWKDAADAVGLALWALDTYRKENPA